MAQPRKPTTLKKVATKVDELIIRARPLSNNVSHPRKTASSELDVDVIVSGFADAVKKVVTEHRAHGRAVYSVDADNKIKPS